jgi:hypothetical protein
LQTLAQERARLEGVKVKWLYALSQTLAKMKINDVSEILAIEKKIEDLTEQLANVTTLEELSRRFVSADGLSAKVIDLQEKIDELKKVYQSLDFLDKIGIGKQIEAHLELLEQKKSELTHRLQDTQAAIKQAKINLFPKLLSQLVAKQTALREILDPATFISQKLKKKAGESGEAEEGVNVESIVTEYKNSVSSSKGSIEEFGKTLESLQQEIDAFDGQDDPALSSAQQLILQALKEQNELLTLQRMQVQFFAGPDQYPKYDPASGEARTNEKLTERLTSYVDAVLSVVLPFPK